MARVGISLGSNLGKRLTNITEAIRRLKEARSTEHLLVSGLYQTAPVDCSDAAPDFYNCVVEIESELSPPALLELTQGIEETFGRPSERPTNAPRVIDLDLLYFDDTVIQSEHLVLPHPRMTQRAFVLLPLRDIRPDLVNKSDLNKVSEQAILPLDHTDWTPIL